MPHTFYTAYPGIKKHLERLSTTAKKLDYLQWIRKEMKNMISEFNRISPELMFQIAKEGFSSRNKHLDRFIKIGISAKSSKNEYNINKLYEYVKEQIYIRRNIVIPQIENEIEYLEYQFNLSTNTGNKVRNEFDNKKNLQQNDTQNKTKVLKRFKWGELKKNCKKYAIEFGLMQGETLTKENIIKVCKALEEEGYEVNQGSVGSVLRDKLRYKKKKDY